MTTLFELQRLQVGDIIVVKQGLMIGIVFKIIREKDGSPNPGYFSKYEVGYIIGDKYRYYQRAYVLGHLLNDITRIIPQKAICGNCFVQPVCKKKERIFECVEERINICQYRMDNFKDWYQEI